MKNKTLSLRIFSILLIVCMLTLSLPFSAFAVSDYIAVAVTDEHAETLEGMFTSVTNAKNYASIEHKVDLPIGKAIQLDVVGVLLRDYDVVWESSNPSVAKVDATGRLVAAGSGTAKVKATSGDNVAELTVTVVPKLEIKYKTAKLSVNKLCNLDLNISGDLNKYLYRTEWSTSDGDLAQVGNGLVLGQKVGNGSIMAQVYDKTTNILLSTSQCDISVYERMTSIKVANKTNSMELGSTYQLRVETVPVNQKAVWVSSNTDIATVDADGRVTATGIGRVTIYAYGGCWKDNTYVKDSDIVEVIEIDVWSSSTVQYNANIGNNQNGSVTLSKNQAFENEVVTIYAKDVIEQKLEAFEAKGATVISVIDASGRSVKVTNVEHGVYTFVMPKSNVTINPVYSSLYNVSVDTGLSANMARDNNLVAKINVNEYVGGSFTGTFSFSGNDYVLSKVVCDYATTISNANGKIVVNVNDARTIPGKFVIEVYADSQTITDGVHGVVIGGDANMRFSNTFTSCNVGTIAKNAVEVDMDFVNSNTTNKILTISTAHQVVIHGEALKYIQNNNISILMKFIAGELEIPAASLKTLSTSDGGYTTFEFKVEPDSYGSEDVFGAGTFNIRTFTASGLSQEQLTMIGKVKLTVYTDDNQQLTIKAANKTIESGATSNVFELNSLAGLGSFSLTMKGSLLGDDAIFIAIVVVLILALLCAVVFLMKRLRAGQIDEHAKGDGVDDSIVDDSVPVIEDESSPAETNDDFREDDVDIKSFKTVDDILKESNLEEEAAQIRAKALDELRNEAAREISEFAISEGVLLSDDQIAEIKYNLDAINMPGETALNSIHTGFKQSMNIADSSKDKAMEMINDSNVTVDVIHEQIEDLRYKTSVMMQQRNEYDAFCKTLFGDLEAAFAKIAMLQNSKKELVEVIERSKNVMSECSKELERFKETLDRAKHLVDYSVPTIVSADEDYAVAYANLCALSDEISSATAFCSSINVDTTESEIRGYIDRLTALMDRIDTAHMLVVVSALIELCNAELENIARKEAEQKFMLIEEINKVIVEIENGISTGNDVLNEALTFVNESVNTDVVDKINDASSSLLAKKLATDIVLDDDLDSVKTALNNLTAVRDEVVDLNKVAEQMRDDCKNNYNAYYLTVAIDSLNNAIANANTAVQTAMVITASATDMVVDEEPVALVDEIKNVVAATNTVQTDITAHVVDEVEAIKRQEEKLVADTDELNKHVDTLSGMVAEINAARVAAEEEAKRLAEEEAARIAAEEEAKRLAEEEAARIAAEEEAKRLAEEEAARIAAEEEAKRLAEEEAARIAAEEEAKRLAEEEAARVAAEEEAKRLAEEEAARIAAEEEAKRLAEEEAARIAAEEEAKRLAEEEAARIAAEEKAKRLAEEEAARVAAEEEAKRLAEEEAARVAAEEEAKRLAEEEAARVAAEEEAKRLAEEEAARKKAEAARKRKETIARKKAEAEAEAARLAAEEIKPIEEEVVCEEVPSEETMEDIVNVDDSKATEVISDEAIVEESTEESADVDEDALRLAEEEAARIAAEEEAKRLAEEEAARVAAEKAAAYAEARKSLIPRFEEMLSREAEEYNRTVDYLNTTENLTAGVKKDYMDYLETTHKHIQSVAAILDTVNNTMLNSLLNVMDEDIETMTFMRGDEVVENAYSIQPSRLPRKKLSYYQSQLDSDNPYTAYVANTKVAAHKLRVRLGRQAHKENSINQKSKKK